MGEARTPLRWARESQLLGPLLRPGRRGRYAIGALTGQIAFAIITFAGAVLAARLFGPDGKGELTVWTLTSALGGLLLAGSIPTGFARMFLDDEANDLPAGALRHAAVALAATVVVAGVAALAGIDPLGALCFVVIGVTASVMVEDVAAVMVAAKRPWAFAVIRIARSLILAGGLAIGLLTSASLDLAFILWAAGSLGSVIAALFVARRLIGGPPMELRRAWGLGRGSAVTRVSTWGVRRLDQFIVAAIAGLPALGLYNAAVNLSEITEYAGAAIGLASFESEGTLDDRAARRILRLSLGLLTVISLFVTAAGFALIAPIFGEEFADARWVLVLLAPGLVLRGPAIAGSQIMLARGRGRTLSRIMVLTLACGGILWTVGTLSWGIEGAAAASTIVYALQAGLVRRALLGPSGRGGRASVVVAA